jgi:3-oxoacyl-[acyl-carrier-protein] synthase II
VSAHATATPFSDAAEARAIRHALGEETAKTVIVHPFKAQAGHTLGAAGALESLVAVDALERGVFPAAAGAGAMDPDTPMRLLALGERGAPCTALKLSAAFGGANAALVISKSPSTRPARARRDVYVSRALHVSGEPEAVSLAAEIGQPPERVARADVLTRLALASVGRLLRRLGSLAGAGIVVGEAFATLETDAMFHARIEDRGARMAEPRRFPYTSPNAAAGECSVVFGLTGPGFAVGAGLCAGVEALVIACDLVRSGDAERIVVVASDHVGPAVSAICGRLGIEASSGAVALLVTASPLGAAWRVDETRLELGPSGPASAVGTGHRALMGLTEDGHGHGHGHGEVRLMGGGAMSAGTWAVVAGARLSPV